MNERLQARNASATETSKAAEQQSVFVLYGRSTHATFDGDYDYDEAAERVHELRRNPEVRWAWMEAAGARGAAGQSAPAKGDSDG